MEVDRSEGMLKLFRKEIVMAWTWMIAVERVVDRFKRDLGGQNQ